MALMTDVLVNEKPFHMAIFAPMDEAEDLGGPQRSVMKLISISYVLKSFVLTECDLVHCL